MSPEMAVNPIEESRVTSFPVDGRSLWTVTADDLATKSIS